MRIGLLTDGGHPYATGESRLWCDRLVRGLARHESALFVLSRSSDQEAQGWVQLLAQAGRVRTAPLWTADEDVPAGAADRTSNRAAEPRTVCAALWGAGGGDV